MHKTCTGASRRSGKAARLWQTVWTLWRLRHLSAIVCVCVFRFTLRRVFTGTEEQEEGGWECCGSGNALVINREDK